MIPSRIHLDRVARIVLAGGLVAYPTEAVWGLGCLPHEQPAVDRLLDIKQRSWRKGFLLIAASVAQLDAYVDLPEEGLRNEILASWPGPATWTLPAKSGIPHWLTGGRPTLAVRVTAHEPARRLCQRVGEPLISTSANRGQREPIRRELLLRRTLGRAIDAVLPGPLGAAAQPTEIRDGRTGRILRHA